MYKMPCSMAHASRWKCATATCAAWHCNTDVLKQSMSKLHNCQWDVLHCKGLASLATRNQLLCKTCWASAVQQSATGAAPNNQKRTFNPKSNKDLLSCVGVVNNACSPCQWSNRLCSRNAAQHSRRDHLWSHCILVVYSARPNP